MYRILHVIKVQSETSILFAYYSSMEMYAPSGFSDQPETQIIELLKDFRPLCGVSESAINPNPTAKKPPFSAIRFQATFPKVSKPVGGL